MIVMLGGGLALVYYQDNFAEKPRHEQGDTVPCLFTTRQVSLAEPFSEENTEVRQTVIDEPGFVCIPAHWAYKGSTFTVDVPPDTRLLPSMLTL